MKLINYEQKAMIPLTGNEKILHVNQIVCFLCGEEFCNDKSNTKEYKKRCKVRDHCHFTGRYCVAAHDVCNSCYKVSKTIPVVFHMGSTYDHHFIIKHLAKDFNGYFNCIGENTEKYMRFSITIIKESDKVSKRKNSDGYSLKFIDSHRFMPAALEKHVKNLTERAKSIAFDVLQERFYNTYQLCNGSVQRLI